MSRPRSTDLPTTEISYILYILLSVALIKKDK